MCKLYIETSDLDKAINIADIGLREIGFAILDLKSTALNTYAEERAKGIPFVTPLQHTKFSILAGIAIGLELGKTGLTLLTPDQYADAVNVDDLVTAYEVA